MRMLMVEIVLLSSLMMVAACADSKGAARNAPPTHQSPAALDMRGDCITPPCGAANHSAYR